MTTKVLLPKVILLVLLYLCGNTHVVYGRIVYQNFETNNGTPDKFGNSMTDQPEYGWAFGDAVAHRSNKDDPVHSGEYSWALTIPKGKPVTHGTGIPAQAHTYNINFVPTCHNQLTFWIWSNPSEQGDHTVMVKFFDRDKYRVQGIGVWTTEKAKYKQWTQLKIMFDRLPKDFDLEHVDKIELFNYWDGTYFYDDITIASGLSEQWDNHCMENEQQIVCNANKPYQCISVHSSKGSYVLDYLQLKRNSLVAF